MTTKANQVFSVLHELLPFDQQILILEMSNYVFKSHIQNAGKEMDSMSSALSKVRGLYV